VLLQILVVVAVVHLVVKVHLEVQAVQVLLLPRMLPLKECLAVL